jgi:hypothetical protein
MISESGVDWEGLWGWCRLNKMYLRDYSVHLDYSPEGLWIWCGLRGSVCLMYSVRICIWYRLRLCVWASDGLWLSLEHREQLAFAGCHHTHTQRVIFVQRPSGAIDMSYFRNQRTRATSATFNWCAYLISLSNMRKTIWTNRDGVSLLH